MSPGPTPPSLRPCVFSKCQRRMLEVKSAPMELDVVLSMMREQPHWWFRAAPPPRSSWCLAQTGHSQQVLQRSKDLGEDRPPVGCGSGTPVIDQLTRHDPPCRTVCSTLFKNCEMRAPSNSNWFVRCSEWR
eukprot:3126055-Amphidinium_carterae.5